MYDPLKVSLENIIPLTEARDHFSQIVAEVQKDKLYVLTKGGKPAVAIIDVKYLEQVTGGEIKEEHIEKEIEKAPEKVGLPPMVEHLNQKPTPPPAAPVYPTPISKPSIPQSTPPPISQPAPPKPAGFAAPQVKPTPPPLPPIKTDVKPQPSPNPISATPPPAPLAKSEPLTSSQPAGFAAPQAKPTPPPPPATIQTSTSTPTVAPLQTPPLKSDTPATQNTGQKIDIQFSPDDEDMKKMNQDGKIPDESRIDGDAKNPPAQYAGEQEKSEPEDMVID